MSIIGERRSSVRTVSVDRKTSTSAMKKFAEPFVDQLAARCSAHVTRNKWVRALALDR
jgi:hypothetical protein